MIRCTHHLLLILVAALALTGCMPTAPQARGSQATGLVRVTAVVNAGSSTTEVEAVATAEAAIARTPTASLTFTVTPTASAQPTATPSAAASLSPTLPAASSTPAPTVTRTPAATATPESAAVLVEAAANVRSGPSTAYPIISGARVGQRLPVIGQAGGWWQITFAERTGWVWGTLVTPNAAAQQAPLVKDLPPLPSAEIKAEAKAEIISASASTSSQADLVVLGPETQYPVRARVIRGWGYEFMDASTAYDIVVYRDVFGMLAHQIDDENVQRYRRQSRFVRSGPLRITLVDAQSHPDPGCPGWGWAPNRATFVDPYGMPQDPCRVEHSLFPQGDGAGTTLLIGWGYNAGITLAIGAAGSRLADASTTFLAETLPWPAKLGPADRPDFSQPLYRPLGAAHREDGRWVWQDAFAQIVPAAR